MLSPYGWGEPVGVQVVGICPLPMWTMGLVGEVVGFVGR